MPTELTLADLEKGGWDYLPSTIWDYYVNTLSTLTSKLPEGEYMEWWNSLPRGIQFTKLWTCFDGDILNGGIAQFLYNHSRFEVTSTMEMLQTTGLHESAEILQQALPLYRAIYSVPSNSDNEGFPANFLRAYESPELNRLSDLRCNDEWSNRDYIQLNGYLLQHLSECVYQISNPSES